MPFTNVVRPTFERIFISSRRDVRPPWYVPIDGSESHFNTHVP